MTCFGKKDTLSSDLALVLGLHRADGVGPHKSQKRSSRDAAPQESPSGGCRQSETASLLAEPACLRDGLGASPCATHLFGSGAFKGGAQKGKKKNSD